MNMKNIFVDIYMVFGVSDLQNYDLDTKKLGTT